MLIADGFASGRIELDAETIRQRTVALVEAGVPWVSLRDHEADEDAFASAARDLVVAVRRVQPGLTITVHGRLAVALDLGTGLHVGWRGASLRTAREAQLVGPVGVSAHSASAALRAAKDGADYVTFSPVFATRSHPDAVPAGIDPLKLAASRAGIPVLALGGMTPPRARIARLVGAYGAAASSSLLFAWDEAVTVRQFLDAVGASGTRAPAA